MNKDERISEEQLNAFVDDELDPEEKSRVFNEAGHSPDLDQRLCQQRKVKELVKFAYRDVPTPGHTGKPALGRRSVLGRGLAAALLLAVGLTAGFLSQFAIDRDGGQAVVATAPGKYLLHVASGEPQEMAAALERAEQLLKSAPDGEFRQVEIVANEQGLNLLREDVTSFASEIAVLQASDVVFYACSKTIQKLEDNGVEVRLVPHAIADYTALDRVVLRMQEGWSYEKI